LIGGFDLPPARNTVDLPVLSCFHGAEISELDKSFYDMFMEGRHLNWWDAEPGSGKYPAFDDLAKIFQRVFEKVSCFGNATHTD